MTELMTEEQEQIHLMTWAKLNEFRFPQLRLLFHIPNGGKRSKREAARFKAAGVKAGVPDLFLPVPCNGYTGLFIELKRAQGGVASEAQKQWLKDLARNGYAAYVCNGWMDAAEVIRRYLTNDG